MPFCMGDTIHSISASILFHGTKMIQVRVLSLERSVHLQPIETSNSKRHPDHWWPLMTIGSLTAVIIPSPAPLIQRGAMPNAKLLPFHRRWSWHWSKWDRVEQPNLSSTVRDRWLTLTSSMLSLDYRILQDIAGYCRILQDYWPSSLLYWYYSYPTHLAFLKCARGDRHETIWSTWRELVSRDPWGLCLQAKHLHGL